MAFTKLQVTALSPALQSLTPQLVTTTAGAAILQSTSLTWSTMTTSRISFSCSLVFTQIISVVAQQFGPAKTEVVAGRCRSRRLLHWHRRWSHCLTELCSQEATIFPRAQQRNATTVAYGTCWDSFQLKSKTNKPKRKIDLKYSSVPEWKFYF